ncbi:BRCA1-associated RING domain protein 1 [Actinomortierella ambigua]|nr:BRCA1-associated RING domain protein 1 [Actinomortierella ambigua]
MQALRMGESIEPQALFLPNNVPGLLRAMAAEFKCSIWYYALLPRSGNGLNDFPLQHRNSHHITRRGLNPVEHLARVIDCFNTMREAYEAETDISLSQAPRQSWTKEPQDNLSQLYPYPEKSQGSSREHQQQQQRPSQQLQSTRTPTPSTVQAPQTHLPLPSQTSTNQPRPTQDKSTEEQNDVVYGPQDEDQDDLSCFDMNLDMVPAEEQAWLAEQMIRLVGQLSLGGQASTQAAGANQRPHSHLSNLTRALPTPSTSTPTSRSSRSALRSASVQLEDNDIPSHDLYVKEEPSDETRVALSITSLTPKMKQFVQKVAKALNTPIIEGYHGMPTHVVTQSSPESGFKGKGRTIKYFLCILRGCWMVNYSWVEASFRAGYWVKEDLHQAADNEFGNNGPKRSRASHARGDPKLLDGYMIQLFGKFTVPSRADLELLIETGGGKVVEDLLADLEGSSFMEIKAEENDPHTSASSSMSRPSKGANADGLPYIKQEPEEAGLEMLSTELPPTQVIESKPRVRRRVLLFDADKISKRGQDQVLDALRDLRSRAQTLAADQAQQSNLQYPVGTVDLLPCSNLLDCIAQYDMAQLVPLSVD